MSSIYIDPKIDLQSEEYVGVIIQFKTRPAQVAVANSNTPLTIEEAKQHVDASHALFREELKNILEQKHIQYFITHTYKDVLNGVSMKLKGTKIKQLLQSKEVEAIYANQKVDLPIKPIDHMYQL